MLGALVSAHSYRRNSRNPDAFEVRILKAEDEPELQQRGKTLLRGGHERAWDPDDLQSFTPLRFAVPELLGTRAWRWSPIPTSSRSATSASCSRATCRARRSGAGRGRATTRSPIRSRPRSCCSTARSCRTGASRRTFDALWEHRIDYLDWINLKLEKLETIGLLEPEWNDFDQLTPAHQAAPQHEAADAAVEDRPADRLHVPRAQGAAQPRAADRPHGRAALHAPPRPQPGSLFLCASGRGPGCRVDPGRSGREGGAAQATSGRIRRSLSSVTAATCGRRRRLLQKPPDAVGDDLGIIGRVAGLRLVEGAGEALLLERCPEEA